MKRHLLILFAALLPLLASAEKVEIDGIWYSLITKGKAAEVINSPDGEIYSGSITIPNTVTYEGVDYSVTKIGDHAFYGCYDLTAVNIPESVTNIGQSAFSFCSLTTINIPESVTSIELGAFNSCSLTAITIPESITSISGRAFANCSDLVTITIPESVTEIGESAFSGCSSLISITIPENVTSIGYYAFGDCSSLTSINIPKSVMNIEYNTFESCKSLTTITVADENLTYDSRNKCNAIIETNSNTLLVGCSATIIPENVKRIGDSAFYGCTNLTAINIPESVTSIGMNAFNICSNLATINISENVTSIEYQAFANCFSLTAITIPESVMSIGEYAFCNCSSLASITIPEGVTSIGGGAFKYCSTLATIVLPKTLEHIHSNAFSNCLELHDVYCYAETLPSTETDSFDGSYLEYSTLHVPDNAVEDYKSTAPWNSFGTIVKLGAAITRITLDIRFETLTEGDTLQIKITTTPENVDFNLISWSSSNPSVVTVDNTGKVTAIAPGAATITATANDGSGVSASCKVTVSPASYVVTFLVDGDIFLTDTLTRGTAITLPEVPTKEGYTFSVWGKVPETMPAGDLTISGTYIINKYLVTFKMGDEVVASDSLEYKSAIVAPEAPNKEGHTFNGWGEVDATVPTHDVTYEGRYSVNSYLLTYVVDGETIHSDSVKYETAIIVMDEPTKEGHTFCGWGEVPETMPAKDMTISGTFTINKYLVTFKIGDEVIASESIEYGASIVAPEAPAKEGYTFNGWGEIVEATPAHDLTYEGNYSINTYTLTYMVDGEVVLTLPIVYGAAIPSLKVPTKEGYTFSGWNEMPKTMPANDVTIEGTFTRLPSIYLTINQADNGYVKQHLVAGAVCTFTIEAAEGWEIHSVTFNGEDVTSQLTEEGTFTTLALQADAVLNIAYEKIEDNTTIKNASARAIKVQGHRGTLRITGAAEGEAISVYTTGGTLVASEAAQGDDTHLTLPEGQVYIVTVADKVVKIGM